MLQCVKTDIVTGKEERIVFGVSCTAEGGKYYSFKEILGTTNTIQHLAQLGERVYVQAQRGAVPFVSDGTGQSPSGTADYSGVFSFLRKFTHPWTDEVALKMQEKLGNQVGFMKEDLNNFKKALDEFEKYRQGEESIKIQAPEFTYYNAEETVLAVRDHNARLGPQFEYITSSVNKTNFMESYSDQFFIELPEYDKLRGFDFEMVTMVPTRRDIARPYPHPIYNTPYYQKYFERSPDQRREDLERVGTFYHLTPEEKSNVARIDFGYVTGFAKNNDLGIQENELDFYNALKEYIKYDISQFKPEEDVEENYKNCIASPRMMEFLDEVLEQVLKLNWSHTNKFPFDRESDVDDDDDDAVASTNYSGRKDGEEVDSADFFPVSDGMVVADYTPRFSGFIQQAAISGMGFDAYIEAIIKVARWGDVKPSVLKLGEYPKYFDMNKFTVRSNTGNFESMKPKLVDGYETTIVGFIGFDEKFRDFEYRNKIGVEAPIVSIPVGVVVARFYENDSRQLTAMSMIDLVQEYKNNPESKLVKGVGYEGGKFSLNVKEELAEETVMLRKIADLVAKDSEGTTVYYESQSVKELMLEFKTKGLSNLKVLYDVMYSNDQMTKWYDSLKFSSHEELAAKARQFPQSKEMYLRVNIANVILPVVLKASDLYEKAGVTPGTLEAMRQAMDIYSQVMDQLGYKGEGSFLGAPSEVVEEPKTSALGDKLKRMESFAQTIQPESKPIEVTTIEVDKTKLFMPIEKDDKLISLVDGNDIFGCVAIRTVGNEKIQILGDKRHLVSGMPKSPYGISFVTPAVFKTLSLIMQGKGHTAPIKFADEEVLVYYSGYLQKIFTKEQQLRKAGK